MCSYRCMCRCRVQETVVIGTLNARNPNTRQQYRWSFMDRDGVRHVVMDRHRFTLRVIIPYHAT